MFHMFQERKKMGYYINLQKSLNDIQKSVNMNILKAFLKEFRIFSQILTLREDPVLQSP